MGPFRDSQHEGEHFEGHGFPSEAEWLHLTMSTDGGLDSTAGLQVSSDFVERTVHALREDRAAHPSEPSAHAGGNDADEMYDVTDSAVFEQAMAASELPADLLREFAAPEPAVDFVARTVAAVHADRLARWHELLARYVAPEPSPEFVARTLSALTADRRAGDRDAGEWADPMAVRRGRSWQRRVSPWLRRAWPLLAVAAAALLWFAPWSSARAPLELRLSQHEPAAFAYSYAATPLPAVLASLNHAADPIALDDGGADGVWLLLGSKE